MFKNIFDIFRFYAIVVFRAIKIIFRKDKSLKRKHINYYTNNVSINSLCVIDVKFYNALYYQINNTKYLYEGNKVVNIEHLIDNKIIIRIKGLTDTINEIIEINPVIENNFNNFKLNANNIQLDFNENFNEYAYIPKKGLNFCKVKSVSKNIKLKKHNSHLNYSNYNQNNFI
ncbi:MAG: hypothetical protein ABNG96_03080 [Flavobacterium sp.]|jgi:hypothetical protein